MSIKNVGQIIKVLPISTPYFLEQKQRAALLGLRGLQVQCFRSIFFVQLSCGAQNPVTPAPEVTYP